MSREIKLFDDLVIPESELEITASRAGGPGGQHVNKTSSRITVRWNIETSAALSDAQKALIKERLASELTSQNDLIVHSGATRSQVQNKALAFEQLAHKIRKALTPIKQRKKTKISKLVKKQRINMKRQRGEIKKLRQKKIDYD